jgi:hypothetical protein
MHTYIYTYFHLPYPPAPFPSLIPLPLSLSPNQSYPFTTYIYLSSGPAVIHLFYPSIYGPIRSPLPSQPIRPFLQLIHPIYSPTYPSIHLPRLFIHLPYPSIRSSHAFYLSIYRSVRLVRLPPPKRILSIHLPTYLSTRSFIHLLAYPIASPIHSFIHSFTHSISINPILSHPFTYLFTYPHLSIYTIYTIPPHSFPDSRILRFPDSMLSLVYRVLYYIILYGVL